MNWEGLTWQGRFEDGSPVVLTNDEGVIGAGSHNNFNYDKDPSEAAVRILHTPAKPIPAKTSFLATTTNPI